MSRHASEIEAYAEADLAWHAAVVAAAHNRFLAGIQAALAQILRSERITGATMRSRAGQGPSRTLQDHTEVTAAIADGDADRAEASMRRHLERARVAYEAFQQQAAGT